MISTAQVVSILAATAAAMPTTSAPTTSNPFTLIATHSGDENVHLHPINAADGQFFIGRATASYCPADSLPAGACPPGNETAFLATAETKALALDTAVPGGQRVFIDPSGILGFTKAHSGNVPEGAIVVGFDYTPSTPGAAGSLRAPKPLTACPTGNDGEYQVKAVLDNLSYAGCVEIGTSATDITVNGAAAWQYS